MIKVWIYAVIMIMLLTGYIVRKKSALSIILWSAYTFIGVFSVICVEMGMFSGFLETSVWPYLFLILIYAISFFPYAEAEEFDGLKFRQQLPRQYYWFAIIYSLMALVTIRLYLPKVLELVRTGEWFKNIEEMYDGKTVYPYSNRIEYICIQIVSYTRLLAMIIGFAFLRNRRDYAVGLILIFCALFTAVLTALYVSSRAIIAYNAMLTLSLYIFFRKQYAKKMRFGFSLMFGLGAAIIIPLMSAITISRFSNAGASSSLLRYFGQAPVVFSGGVSGITMYTYGIHGFGQLFNQRVSQSAMGGSWGTGFYTYVGWLFMDWGPLGTVIVVCLLSVMVWFIVHKKQYSLSDIYLVFFVYYTLLQGVFVIGTSYCYQIVMTVLIYFGLKLLDDNKEYYFGGIRKHGRRQPDKPMYRYIKADNSKIKNTGNKYIKL